MKPPRCTGAGRALPGAIAVMAAGSLLAGSLAGCSVIARATGGQTGGQSGFQAALARIAATPGTRGLIFYDDTGALVKLAGTSWSAEGGFAALRGTGAGPLTQLGRLLASDPGINLLGASYTISAGRPPQQVGLLAGGQQGQRISSGLARLGWTRARGRLLAPSPENVGGNQQYTSVYALDLAQVRITGSGLRYGGAQADLGEVDSPSGPTLAVDPRTRALAGCLGDVVAAEIDAGYRGGPSTIPSAAASPSPSPRTSPSASPAASRSAAASPVPSASPSPAAGPAAVAAGVRRPRADTAAPHAVVCVAWPTQAAADNYASELGRLLPGGVAPDLGVPYSRLLAHPSVRDIGGSQHLVAWQADTPGNAALAIQMTEDTTLPALPDCAHLPPQTAGHTLSCSG